MLVEFRVENFKSCRDEQVLSLVANSDNSLKDNYAEVGKYRLLKTAAIYGPNASGKSNIIEAMFAMRYIVLRSATRDSESRLPAIPFAFDHKSRSRPTTFEVSFLHEEVLYQYGFTVSESQVFDEWLFAFPKNRAQLWFQREFDHEREEYEWTWGTKLKGEKQQLAGRTKKDSLFLSVAAQWNHEQLLKVFNWFGKLLGTISTRDHQDYLTEKMLKGLDKEEDATRQAVRGLILELLETADMGISGVTVREKDFEKDVSDKLSEKARLKAIEQLKKILPFDVEVHHKIEDGEEYSALPLKDESAGTQRFFQLLGPWIKALYTGSTILVDELEASLHPLLSRKLVELFIDKLRGVYGAQLIFTTHDSTLLDQELFRRDQVWFTEKDDCGATTLYSLADYRKHPARKGEALQKGYLSGRYGAIPILERFGIKDEA